MTTPRRELSSLLIRSSVFCGLFLLLTGLVACQSQPVDADAQTATTSPATSSVPVTTSTIGSTLPYPSIPDSTRASTSTTSSITTTTQRVAATVPEDFVLAVETVADGLGELTAVRSPPGDDGLFVLTQTGQVLVLDQSGGDPQVVHDLSDRVVTGAEQGMLAIAFHPTFPETGRFFLHFTEAPEGDTRIVELTLSPDGSVDPSRERLVFGLDQPHRWHNGGGMSFGPDGYLWTGLGDGGPGGDPEGRGQDPSNVFGTLLRIDPDGTGGQFGGYGIPPDNPFADGEGGAPEVWAYGLRNPWRFYLDSVGGSVYIADVGQYLYEEISVVPLEGGGANLGWPIREGMHCFAEAPCDAPDLVDPVVEYVHEGGRCAVIGGDVYRGSALPELWGHYLYADACSGELWSFLHRDGEVVQHRSWVDVVGALEAPSSFGTDSEGELLITTTGGSVHRIVPGG